MEGFCAVAMLRAISNCSAGSSQRPSIVNGSIARPSAAASRAAATTAALCCRQSQKCDASSQRATAA